MGDLNFYLIALSLLVLLGEWMTSFAQSPLSDICFTFPKQSTRILLNWPFSQWHLQILNMTGAKGYRMTLNYDWISSQNRDLPGANTPSLAAARQ